MTITAVGKRQEGFSLAEILVAVAVIALVAAVLVPLFSSSFANIFFFGRRDQALALAAERMEALYARQPLDYAWPLTEGSISDLEAIIGGEYVETAEELILYSGDSIKFRVEPAFSPLDQHADLKGYRFTIAVFYNNNQSHVLLQSFVRGAPGDD